MACADLASLVVAAAAVLLALVALGRASAAGARLSRLEAELARQREQLAGAGAAGGEPAARMEGDEAAAPAGATAAARAAAPRAAHGGTAGVDAKAAESPLVAPAAPVPPAASGAVAGEARHGGFEALVGARVLPWIAAMALAFAGAYLVKYSFEHGWISPPVRVALGVAFGLVMLALSMAVRRTAGRISEALAAAGVADLFACFLSAVHVYHLVAPAAGFGLMALTTAVAVALSLRQGIMVALLGLIGGFLTPALVQTAQPSARNLFGYLLLLVAGLLAVARRRGWPWLAFGALAAAFLWAGVWLAGPLHGAGTGADAAWLSLFLVLLAGAAALAGGTPPAPSPAARVESAAERAAVLLAVGAAMALLAGTAARSGYALDEWAFLELLAAGLLALAWFEPRRLPLAWIAAAALAALLAFWGAGLAPEAAARFLAVAATAGGLFAAAGWSAAMAAVGEARSRGGPSGARSSALSAVRPSALAAARPGALSGQWAALSAASGVTFFLVAWGGAHTLTGSADLWGGAALALAALYVLAAVPVARLRHRLPEIARPLAAHAALAALAVAATSLVSLAVPIVLARQSLAVAWALEAAALIWLAGRLAVPVLDALARLLALAAVAGALLSDAVARAAGGPPVLNELLYAYGVPLAALAAAAWLAARRRAAALPSDSPRLERMAAELQWEALLLLFLLAALEMDQLFQTTDGRRPDLGLVDLAAVSVAWLLLGWGLLRIRRAAAARFGPPAPLPARPLELAGRCIVLAGLAAAVLGGGLVNNPLWTHQAVGSSPLLNAVLFGYGLPACLALLAAGEVARQGGRRLPVVARVVALALGFACISLEVRQVFHGTYLDTASAARAAAERYSYSAAWVLYGIGLLLAGIARRNAILRYGSLGVMLLAVLKVFLYDTARLSDLYRVLSFLGLGASLLLLAFLYQRFVLHGPGERRR